MGEPENPHFYDFGISEPATKPQHQLFLSLETPRYPKNQEKSWNLSKTYYYNYYQSRNLETQNVDNVRKDEHREMMKIRLTILENL